MTLDRGRARQIALEALERIERTGIDPVLLDDAIEEVPERLRTRADRSMHMVCSGESWTTALAR